MEEDFQNFILLQSEPFVILKMGGFSGIPNRQGSHFLEESLSFEERLLKAIKSFHNHG